jgi:hypothetical protein
LAPEHYVLKSFADILYGATTFSQNKKGETVVRQLATVSEGASAQLPIAFRQCWARSFYDDTLMKRYDKIRFGISDLPIREKKCESQKCIV